MMSDKSNIHNAVLIRRQRGDLACFDIEQEPLGRRKVDGAADETALVIALGLADPALILVSQDVCLDGFPGNRRGSSVAPESNDARCFYRRFEAVGPAGRFSAGLSDRFSVEFYSSRRFRTGA